MDGVAPWPKRLATSDPLYARYFDTTDFCTIRGAANGSYGSFGTFSTFPPVCALGRQIGGQICRNCRSEYGPAHVVRAAGRRVYRPGPARKSSVTSTVSCRSRNPTEVCLPSRQPAERIAA